MVAETQDTLVSGAGASFGVGWIDHRLSFQRSIRAAPSASPTAVQTVAEVHTALGDTGYHAPAAFGYRPFEGGLALKRLAPARS